MSAPARLLSVRLQGFKSFADRTHVAFGPGISAVVGPNGSGKSNLADALRWALGEQGRALRSRRAEDVIWAGSERRPAVGMADVQLTLDNADGLLPVEFGTVELGRRLYRSGENDYLLNRQRVRLKDLVDLLDAGHLAENAFLFIGQGMVDQALALRPEERRPLFEEVAGVRRHERRRRRAEEQLTESEANLARLDDILAELRPQARRLAQQAQQHANRATAAEELVSAILLSAHARWHEAAVRAAASAATLASARRALDAAMAELLEQEAAMTAAGAALAGQSTREAEARSTLDGARAERATLQLRDGRQASESDAATRDRTRLDGVRTEAQRDLDAARSVLAEPRPSATEALEEELAGIDADLARLAADEPIDRLGADRSVSDADAAAIRRLATARAEEGAAGRRRAADAERVARDEAERAGTAERRATVAAAEREAAAAALASSATAERAARESREAAQGRLADAEAAARAANDRLAGARATAAALRARLADARAALSAAEGGEFGKLARSRGGRAIGDGLVVDAAFRQAVDAVLTGLSRAQVLPGKDIASLGDERGVAIARESLSASTPGGAAAAATAADAASQQRVLDLARSHGGGALRDGIRRDDLGAVSAIAGRAVWLPDAAACLAMQPALPPGWVAVSRDGSVLVGDLAVWIRPEGRDLSVRADAERLEREAALAEAAATAASTELDRLQGEMAAARSAMATARDAEAVAGAARRRAEELDRAAAADAETAGRDAAWLRAQAGRLLAEAARLRAAAPAEDAARESAGSEAAAQASAAPNPAAQRAAATAQATAALRDRRARLATALDQARVERAASDRRRAQADATIALAERQLTQAAQALAALAEREAHLAHEREDIAAQLADSAAAVAAAEATLASIVSAAASERERLRAAEHAATATRERWRIAGERARLAERDELETRLAVDGLRESMLVELAGLGAVGLQRLRAVAGVVTPAADAAPHAEDADHGDERASGSDPDAAAIEEALAAAAAAWQAAPPAGEPPPVARLATLRRRFHELGAVNPFAADEYAEVSTRLDGLETQRADLGAAIEKTRELIAELDRLVSDQFRRTFAALERAFDARFQQLFAGGFAKLTLTDPQDLSATGVEITARPPGKKPQALSMLSGGERALTAVALLFAMLEVRPVPFCVLDEVDAALDEANIGRFTDALKDLARDTQCIVITHNRGTIEAADALYGVTVGDDSVSRVISLRLDEATAMAGRSTAGRAAAAPEPLGAGAGIE